MVAHDLENLILLHFELVNNYWELVKLYKFSHRIDKDGNVLPETWSPIDSLIQVCDDIKMLLQKYRDATD